MELVGAPVENRLGDPVLPAVADPVGGIQPRPEPHRRHRLGAEKRPLCPDAQLVSVIEHEVRRGAGRLQEVRVEHPIPLDTDRQAAVARAERHPGAENAREP